MSAARKTPIGSIKFHENKCGFCLKRLPTAAGVRRHIQQNSDCRRAWEAWIATKETCSASNFLADNVASSTDQFEISEVAGQYLNEDSEPTNADISRPPSNPFQARVEDAPDEDDEDITMRWVEEFPQRAGEVLRAGECTFERWRKEDVEAGRDRWFPFASEKEWNLGQWLVRNVGQNQIEEFLNLNIIRELELSATSKYKFNQLVDQLPSSMSWIYDQLTITGDLFGEDGKPMTETLDLWRRDPVECVRELIGNPAFRDVMAYLPERVFADSEAFKRIIDEMCTGDWWWDIQKLLPAGATVAPVILASDKTKLSQFRGDQAAWPVYLSIGNISKATRRQVSCHAMILVGYIPTSKLECFSEVNRSLAGYRLFHHCMKSILKSLVEAGTHGVEMVCADGNVRCVFPILAAYIADHPEQCLVVNVKENQCPRGTVAPDERGEPSECTLRNVADTLEALDLHQQGFTLALFEKEGLRPIYEPFWRELPHCDIFSCITPDILHQLHKGVFKDHLISWITSLVGEDELDRRFKAVPNLPGLRYFKKGISHVSQWTGTEHKEMQKVIVALLAGAVDPPVLRAVQAVVDFIYYAQLHVHTTDTLTALREALATFHANKDVFIDYGIREHFNIAKIHSMLHYCEAILKRGALDGFNTELPERLHIEYAKDAYRAGNRRDYIAHMTTWLRRQEAVETRSAYLAWLRKTEEAERSQRSNDASTSEDGISAGHDGDLSDDDNDSTSNEEDEENLRFSSSAVRLHYKLAKRCPYPRTTFLQLTTLHTATEFASAFREYIHDEFPGSPVLPEHVPSFRVYKQIRLEVPHNTYAGKASPGFSRIRAIPAQPAHLRRQYVPAQFDTVLVVEDAELYMRRTSKASLQGLRAARVKAIFELPMQYGRLLHPLAYVEWYTPFTRKDLAVNMYQVSRSTRNGGLANASIISVDRICAPCHLIAKCRKEIDRRWTAANVLDSASVFYVNPYVTLATWASSGLYKKYV